MWVYFGHLINVKRFFQVTSIFLLLFMVQIAIYSFHEFSEAGILPNSEFLHEATEPLSPTGIYGSWFTIIAISACALWLVWGYVSDSMKRKAASTHTPDRMAVR
jgi:high-affinity iron transporter